MIENHENTHMDMKDNLFHDIEYIFMIYILILPRVILFTKTYIFLTFT